MRKLRFDLDVKSDALLCPNPTEFYSKCYISEDIANNFRTIPGVKTSTKIANVLFDNLLKAETCSFTASDEPLNAITLDVCGLSAMAEICRFDIESSFISLQMVKGANASFEVAEFMSYYWDEMSKEIADEIASLRWKGDTGGGTSTYLDLCDGYEIKLLADTSVVDVTLPVAITSGNVIDEMGRTYALLVAACKFKKKDLRFYVSANVAAAYQLAVASGNTIAFVTQELGMTYLGIPIVIQEGMSNDTMVLTMKSNMLYVFDGENDSKALKAINLEDTVAEPLLRTRANLKVGFYFVNPDEIVFYQA